MIIKNKKILVTGGAGFIGSHICERLLKEGAEVVVLDDFSTGKIDNLKKIKSLIKIIRGDILDDKAVKKATNGCDAIIHQAFPYGKSGMGLDNQYVRAGTEGTFNILREAVKSGVKKFIFASTASVYGIVPKYPPIDEKYRTKSFLLYGSTKLCGENFCSTISDLYGLDTTVLRYFYVYGPRYSVFDHSAMVNFINLALRGKPILIYGKGDQLRDYTYIEDVVEATILALKNESTKEKIYNISSGFNTSISDLAATIVRLTNSKSEIKAASHTQYRYIDYCRIPIGITSKKDNQWIDERNYIADISLVKKELGYFPKISLEDGILKTVNWMSKKI